RHTSFSRDWSSDVCSSDLASRPVRVRGNVSSQFLTALLMAAPVLAAGESAPVVIEVEGELISKPDIAITLNLMSRFGVQVVRDGWQRFTFPAGIGRAHVWT